MPPASGDLTEKTVASMFVGNDSDVDIYTTSKVGIGVNTGLIGSLDVQQSGTGWTQQIYNTGSSGNYAGLLVKTADTTATTKAFGIYSGSAYSLVVMNDGKVGIGTTTPGGLLELKTNANNFIGLLINQQQNQSAIHITNPQNTTAWSLKIDGTGNLTTGGLARFKNGSANTGTRSLVQIWNDNALATGTTSLEVINDSTTWAAQIKNTHATDGAGLYIAAGDDNDSPAFRVADKDDNDKFTIQGDGKVGIGTMAPDFLNLQGNATNGGVIGVTRTAGSTTGVLGNIRFGNTDVDSNLANVKGIQDGATDSAKLVFQTQATGGATTERMRIASGGAITFNNAFTFPTADGTAGYHLQTDGAGAVTWQPGGAGTVTSVTAGNGMTQSGTSTINPTLDVVGGTGLTAAANAINLDNTAVTPASYTATNLTVDQQGRITAASSGAANPTAANPSATVGPTATNGSAATFMRSDGAPALADTAVTAASYTYASITVDAQGRLDRGIQWDSSRRRNRNGKRY